jgi:hypothetical protein
MEGIEVFLCPDHLRVNAFHPREGVRKWHDCRKPQSRDSGQVPDAVTLALGAVSGKNHLLPFVI